MKLFAVIYTTPLGIEIFSKAQEAAKYGNPSPGVIPGEVGQQRAVRFQGIPGGVACGSIPETIAASTQSGVPSVPGKIPGGVTSCPTPVGSRREWCDGDPSSKPGQLDVLFIPGQITILFIPGQITILFIPGQIDVLFIPGGGVSLLTPASVGRRALRQPIHAHRAIATAFAWLPS